MIYKRVVGGRHQQRHIPNKETDASEEQGTGGRLRRRGNNIKSLIIWTLLLILNYIGE
jgi:hypothetical protein